MLSKCCKHKKKFPLFSLPLPCLQNLNYYVGNITVKHNDYDCMELKLFFFELLQLFYAKICNNSNYIHQHLYAIMMSENINKLT